MARLNRYRESNAGNIVIATGDTRQLERIDCIMNQHDYEAYRDKCVGLILPASMFFKENQRMHSKKDKEAPKSFKQAVFDASVPVGNTINKYVETTRGLRATYNIAYMSRSSADRGSR